MRDQFLISGLFYTKQNYKFRKYLNIKLRATQKTIPDLIVIMMNPGGSFPLDHNDNAIVESEANPDRTQNQIMKVMLECGVAYTRILNLSDIRDTRQLNLFQAIANMENSGIAHSIFDKRRKNDFQELFVPNVPVLLAWGVNERLRPLALKAIETLGDTKVLGIQKEASDFGYYHPLPFSTPKQKKWVEEISRQLKNKI